MNDKLRNSKLEEEKCQPSWLKTRMVALRMFALPASVMPLVLGTVAAVMLGGVAFKPVLFLLTLLGVVFIHSGSNLLNDYFDYKKGLDKTVLPGSGALVRGWMTPTAIVRDAFILLILGGCIGCYLAFTINMMILWMGVLGVFIGIFYCAAPIGLKYRGLGDMSVFISFGVLGTTGAWIVQIGSFAWQPVLISIPSALLASAILHVNNWRDIDSDRTQGIRTIALTLGKNKSFYYYTGLILSPFIIVTGFVMFGYLHVFRIGSLPFSTLIVWLALPISFRLIKRAKSSSGLLDLVELTAKLNLVFGVLYAGGILLYGWIESVS